MNYAATREQWLWVAVLSLVRQIFAGLIVLGDSGKYLRRSEKQVMRAQLNNSLRYGFVLLLMIGFGAWSGGAQAQSVRLLGDYRDWSAFATSDDAGQLCFAMTKPETVSPQPDEYTQAYLYITHRPGESISGEFNLVAGYEFGEDSVAEVSVGGNSYDLFTRGDAAWLDDATQSVNLAGNIRAGSSLSVEGTTVRGIKIKLVFSLSGATAAQRAIDSECN